MNEKLDDTSAAEEELSRRQYNFAHGDKPKKLSPQFSALNDVELKKQIANGHDYHFVGRVGQFTPIKPGLGGGLLVREKDGKYLSVTGSKGYRWLESENVSQSHHESDVDVSYYEGLVFEAIDAIDKFGSFERFIDTSRPYEDDRPKSKAIDISSEPDDDPPWNDLPVVVPCGDGKYNSCLECPNCKGDVCAAGYSLAVNGGGAV